MKYHYLLGCLLTIASFVVQADVTIAAEGENRLRIVAENASNQAILESLGRELEVDILIDDPEWATQQRSFERAGSLDYLLKTLLSGTSHLLSYRGEDVSVITVLGPGSENPTMFSPTTPRTMAAEKQSARKPAATAARLPGATTDAVAGSVVSSQAPSYGEEDDSSDAQALAPTNIGNLLRNRAQTTASAPANAPSRKTQSGSGELTHAIETTAGIPPGIDQAELARITRQAHQDVKSIAESLRRAEQQLEAAPPE